MKHGTIINGLALETCMQLETESVDCVITSPPYWQLRNYGFSEQWGLEPTYEEYLAHLWRLMDVLYRVLKPQGTAWINLGDTYGTAAVGEHKGDPKNPAATAGFRNKQRTIHKGLLLIPHRFAIGCIERGWILRNDIIWAKPNAMPESVTDRFSKKHEFFFFFAKHTKYYFDLNSIKDTVSQTVPPTQTETIFDSMDSHNDNTGIKNPGDVSDFWVINTKPNKAKHYAAFNSELIDKPIIAGCPNGGTILDPFCGTGTTVLRALQLDRNAIGVEGNPEYARLAENALNLMLAQEQLAL